MGTLAPVGNLPTAAKSYFKFGEGYKMPNNKPIRSCMAVCMAADLIGFCCRSPDGGKQCASWGTYLR